MNSSYGHDTCTHNSVCNDDVVFEHKFIAPATIIKRSGIMFFVRMDLKNVEVIYHIINGQQANKGS